METTEDILRLVPLKNSRSMTEHFKQGEGACRSMVPVIMWQTLSDMVYYIRSAAPGVYEHFEHMTLPSYMYNGQAMKVSMVPLFSCTELDVRINDAEENTWKRVIAGSYIPAGNDTWQANSYKESFIFKRWMMSESVQEYVMALTKQIKYEISCICSDVVQIMKQYSVDLSMHKEGPMNKMERIMPMNKFMGLICERLNTTEKILKAYTGLT